VLIKISKNKIRRIDIVNIKGGMTANQVYKKYKPDFFINLALYDSLTSGMNITKMEDENIQSGYLFSDEGIGINGENELIWCKHSDAINSKEIRDYVSGSPVLVKDGKKCIEWGNKYSEYVDKLHIRSAIGFNNSDINLFVSDKEIGLTKLSQAMIDNKCKYAINCDGGGSCHLQEEEKIYKKSIRKNASWLLIYLRKEVENKMKKVFLGVGHGGKDPGAIGNGLRESDINLSVAQACEKELERHGINVLMSRYKDEDDPLTEEIRECNAYDPDIAIDIHTNAGGGDGFEIYHHSGGANSKRLAEFIETEAAMLNNSRGLKIKLSENTGKDYYGFIRDTKPPAVIIESAFIDNAEDVSVIDELHEQEAFGKAYAKGILNYLGIQFIPEAKAEEVIYRVQVGAFKVKENAEKLLNDLKEKGFNNAFITVTKI
jgi:N-acetylmuramoyl-L-alanine amidase